MIQLTDAQLELVRLSCTNCNQYRIPILMRSSVAGSNYDLHPTASLGAYCQACRRFIKWVPQSSVWLSLEQQQRDVPTSLLKVDDASVPATESERVTDREEAWVSELTDMAQFCWNQAEASGFHDGRMRQPLELCMLVVTELAELAEAFRKGEADKPSDHIPEFTYAEEEWADVLIRVFDHSHDHVYPERLARAFIAKLAYNRTRGYRHGGKTI